MDIPSPQTPTPDPTEDFRASAHFARMLQDLAAALPSRETDTPACTAQRREDACAMVIAANPCDAIEAGLAVSAAIAYYASLARDTLAASRGQTSTPASRYPSPALHRAFQSGVAALDKHRALARSADAKRTRTTPEPKQPFVSQIPNLPQFQPRDRYGKPIKLHRFQDLTKKQVDAAYGDPFNTALWEAAIEEEEIAIAEQKATGEAAAHSATESHPT